METSCIIWTWSITNCRLQKKFKLDIEDAKNLTLSVNYAENGLLDAERGFFDVKTIEFCGTKRRNVEVTVSVTITLLPDFSVSVIEEKDPVKYAVFSIDWDGNTNLFSGTLITKDKAYNVVSECKYVFDVFKGLSKVQKSTTLRGVIANYWNTDEFPVDIHQKVIKALPSPTTKLIVGQIHAYFALHLKNSGIQASDREEIFMIDWCKAVCMRPYYLFFKEQNYYNFFAETHTNFGRLCSNAVIITDTTPTIEQIQEANTFYPHKKIHFSSCSNLTRDNTLNYAWQYFNGENFDGYLVPYFPELSIWLRNNAITYVSLSTRCACNIYSSKSNVLSAKKTPELFGIRKYFAENYHVYAKHIGFAKPILYVRTDVRNCQMIIFKTSIGHDLIPSATVTRFESSLNTLPKPFIQATSDNFPDASAIFVVNINIISEIECDFWFRTLYDNKVMDSQHMPFDEVIEYLNVFTPFVKTKHILVFASEFLTMTDRIEILKKLQKLDCNVIITQTCQLAALQYYQTRLSVDVGKSIISYFEILSMLVTKHENGFKCNKFIRQTAIHPSTLEAEKYNVVYLKKYTLNDYLLSPELQLTAETYNEFIQSISNGTNFYGYLIDDFDDINYQAEWENQNIVIHCGIEKLPFEKTTTLDIGDTEWLKVYAVVRNDKYLIKSYTMKTKKPRRVFLTVKQLTLFDITASLFVLESMPADNEIANPLNNIVVNQSNDSPAKPPTLSEVSQSPEEAISSSESPPSPEVIFTFTANNRILVNAGPDYTGDSEFAAYFRMESSKFGPIVTVGEKAKAAYKKHPKTVIYDIPGLLAADSDLSNENLTWSFKTSRAADGTLLIHLGDNACTSPVPLFASVVKSALLHVKEHLTENVKSVGIRLPEASIISEDNLTKISNMLAVILTVL